MTKKAYKNLAVAAVVLLLAAGWHPAHASQRVAGKRPSAARPSAEATERQQLVANFKALREAKDAEGAYAVAREYLRCFPSDTSADAQLIRRYVEAYEKVAGSGGAKPTSPNLSSSERASSSSSTASVEETLQWLATRINGMGAIRAVSTDGTYGSTEVYRFTPRGDGNLGWRCETTRVNASYDKSVGRPPGREDFEATYVLKDLDPQKVVVEDEHEYLRDLEPGQVWRLTVYTFAGANQTPYTFVVRLADGRVLNERSTTDALRVRFRDKDLAERCARAFVHAITLARSKAGLKPEPF